MYKINNISFLDYGIIAGKVHGEGIALKGCFDLPKRIGDTHYSWADEDSIEPFVDADEIFLAAREIEFAGVMVATKATIEANLESFKTAISAYTNLVLLETPYGSFSVIIKSIIPKIKEGAASVKILFRELEVGLEVVSILPEETTYYSAAYSEDATKNNCDSGYSGTVVTLTSLAGAFTSTLSQIAADQLAIDWVREQKQENANVNGACTLNPPVYYNTKQAGFLFKNDCGAGFEGSMVTYTVAPFTYSSLISQIAADTKAQNEIAANLTQEYANNNGSCSLQNLFYQTFNNVGTFTTTYGSNTVRYQKFFVAAAFPVGTKFYISIYAVILQYTSVINDTRELVINALAALVNNTTEAEWDAFNQAPVFGGNTHKPEAGITSAPIPNLFPQFFTPELFTYINNYGQAIAWFEAP